MGGHIQLLQPDRWLPLPAIAVAILAICLVARRWPASRIAVASRWLAIVVVAAEVSWWGSALLQGIWVPRYNLPLHLCEAGAFVLAVALWTRRQVFVEISYFWGVGGTLPGLFTPVLPAHFPRFDYWQYYFEHGCIVLGAFWLVLVMRLGPRRGAVLRVSGITLLYACFVAVADYFTGGNYLFLRQLPATHSPLDLMGPWPWYLVTCAIVGVAVFSALYLPFRSSSASLGNVGPASSLPQESSA